MLKRGERNEPNRLRHVSWRCARLRHVARVAPVRNEAKLLHQVAWRCITLRGVASRTRPREERSHRERSIRTSNTEHRSEEDAKRTLGSSCQGSVVCCRQRHRHVRNEPTIVWAISPATSNQQLLR